MLQRGSWDEIDKLEPIQQWCAYYIWDTQRWAEFKKTSLQAAAALGDVDRANKLATEIAEILFPYLVESKSSFYEDAAKTMQALRGVKFSIRKA